MGYLHEQNEGRISFAYYHLQIQHFVLVVFYFIHLRGCFLHITKKNCAIYTVTEIGNFEQDIIFIFEKIENKFLYLYDLSVIEADISRKSTFLQKYYQRY